jgi:hypothetical protein
LRLSISLLNSSFISCTVFFISCISILIISIALFQSLLKSSLRSFSCSCFFLDFFYQCSLRIH